MRTDLLIVNPGGRGKIYQSLASRLSAVEPPVWAGLIATFIRRKGFTVDILDANAADLSPGEVADRVRDISPLLTAVVVYGHNPSASTQVMPAAGDVCTAVRELLPDAGTLLVGGHVAALPERTLAEEAASYVCGGEGPYTILDLLRALSCANPDLGKVRGLWHRDRDAVRSNPMAPLVSDLDGEMPGVAWDLLPMEGYRAHNWHCFGGYGRQPYAALYTTLGCPYRCAFCCIHAPFKAGEGAAGRVGNGNGYRMWSPRSVIAEIDTLANDYGVKNIKFADEIFILNRGHVDGICDLLIERGYGLNIWAYARVDTLRGIDLEKLKRAGVNWLALGIESASDRVRDGASKGFAADRILTAVSKIRAAGIHVGANYIFGLPDDDRDSMQETLDLALALNTEWANFNCAMAYPGSPLYGTAVAHGWPLPADWSGYSQYSADSFPLPTRFLSSAEVLRFRDGAFRAYFENPRYLESVEREFGRDALEQIREMTRTAIRRNHA
jgi:radical SAM superfamily enzyme YgiQ (UPF0313 family)